MHPFLFRAIIITDMKINRFDLSKTLRKYSSEWIALNPDTMKVVSAGKTAGKVLDKARRQGISNPVLTRAPQHYGTYIL